jgi:hypothetical protein
VNLPKQKAKAARLAKEKADAEVKLALEKAYSCELIIPQKINVSNKAEESDEKE